MLMKNVRIVGITVALSMGATSFAGCASSGMTVPLVTLGGTAGVLVGYKYLTKGGASSEKNLKRETGRVLSVDPDSVAVTEIHRGMTDVTWKASTPQGKYKCSADDMVRRPTCVKDGGGASLN